MTTGPFTMQGRTVLITGASSGLGHHFAGLLAEAGARVVLAARRVDKLQQRVAELNDAGLAAACIEMDVRSAESIRQGFELAAEAFGLPDVVINNAGMEPGVFSFFDLEESDWDAVIDTNLKGVWLVSREASRRWIAAGRHGNLVNIASILGFRQQKGVTPYAVSKAGVLQLTKQMALEGAKYGIRANALAPGYFYSEVSRALLDSEQFGQFVKAIPQRRAGELSDYDGALLLLASDASAHMTGQSIVVDGGHLVSTL
ncbi:MAG: SDR family oxidoreductase [Pseudomonadales bacterium]|jgi:NAD(P)-dependent dehydrogenase (short-subunit alcohol dehydrogenase family)|nr:SDR family oxidoreductase [Pseudomonadales bacterium]